MIPPRSVRAVSAHWPASEPTQLAPLGSACTSLWRKAPKARGPFFLFLQWMLESLPTGGLDKFYGFFSQVNVLLFSQRLQRAHLKVCKVFVRPQAHKNLTHLQEPGSLASQAR